MHIHEQQRISGFESAAIAARVGFLLVQPATPFGVVTGSRHPRLPMVGFTRWERIPTDAQEANGYAGFAPDICVEVISPSETQKEMRERVAGYIKAGASQVWRLFLREEQVIINYATGQEVMLRTEDTLIVGERIPDFRVRVSDLFNIRPKV